MQIRKWKLPRLPTFHCFDNPCFRHQKLSLLFFTRRISYSTFLLPGKPLLSSYSHPRAAQEPISEGSILRPSEREPRGRASSWQRAGAMPDRSPFPCSGLPTRRRRSQRVPAPRGTRPPAHPLGSLLPRGTAVPPQLTPSRGLAARPVPRPHASLCAVRGATYHHSMPWTKNRLQGLETPNTVCKVKKQIVE